MVRGLLRIVVAAVCALGLAGCATHGDEAPADLILTNARVYTVDAAQPHAEAVSIRDGRIQAVGASEVVARTRGPNTRIIDLGGRLLMPAFGDAHVHPVFGGMAYSRCSLHAGRSVEDYVALIRACLAASPGEAPIYGVGWEDSLFPPNGVPTKEVLDAVSTERALIFESVGGHSYWVNSRALALAGITRETSDPPNGLINRDARGEPSGALQETAMGLMRDLIPQPTAEDIQNSIIYTARLFNSLGITSWHDAGIDLAADGTSQTLDAYHAVQQQGVLSMHVTLAFTWANDRGLEQIPVILEASRRAEAWGLRARTVKFYVDGVIPQRTAAMIASYEGSDERGSLQIAPETLNAAIARLGAEGVQPHVHAIGDLATRVALDAFEAAPTRTASTFRPMISHLNVIDPADQPRFGALDAIAVFQPTWASHYPYMGLTLQAIGPTRSRAIYPAGSVLRGGGMLAYGADWPVATANPLQGLQVAVTRTNYLDASAGPLLPEEGVPLTEAVRAHTLNVAYALGLDAITGSIAPGKSADLIVLDRDIFELAPDQVSQARVLLTLFRGAPVHGSLEELGAPAN